MRGFYAHTLFHLVRRGTGLVVLLTLTLLVSACGGGSSGGSTPAVSSAQAISSTATSASNAIISSSNQSRSSSSASVSSSAALVVISGSLTYDYVPHFTERNGLNYAGTVELPIRGLVVELLDAGNQVLMTDISTQTGTYSFTVTRDQPVRVRVKAQLLREQNDNSARWNFKVTDNTDNNSLYAMVGSLLVANDANAVRDLHAASGWTGNAYTQPRVAAPFAILDSIYIGVQRLVAVDGSVQLPALEFRWSPNNITADGELELGEIATSFYRNDLSAIYLLGGEDDDTDEYDRHVVLHEWGHYLEAELSRSDSIGGDHSGDDKLDFRVAMSEGFANAFSAMMLDDPIYRDASGTGQEDGFQIAVNRINNNVRGWYSEASVQSVLYNFYVSENNKTARDFADIFTVITRDNYSTSDAFVSIYLFAEQLREALPGVTAGFNSLLSGQNITITDRFGAGESNSGGATINLPVYKTLPLNNTAVNVCSSNANGSYNKLGASQFFVLNILSAGNYRITATEFGTTSDDSDPDMYLYQRGIQLQEAISPTVGTETLTRSLSVGTYVLELVDDRAVRDDFNGDVLACFDVRALPN